MSVRGWEMAAGRLRSYDYGVLGLVVLTVIGVSLSWYTGPGWGLTGWNSFAVGPFGILAFVAALAAAVTVENKALFPRGAAPPHWYKEGQIVMVLGGLIALFALIRIAAKPEGGEVMHYGAGVFITLVAGLLIVGCGYLSYRDRVGARSCPRCGAETSADDRFCRSCGESLGEGEGEANVCAGCGAQVHLAARFCASCGRSV
jgi:Double zinc ribbon